MRFCSLSPVKRDVPGERIRREMPLPTAEVWTKRTRHKPKLTGALARRRASLAVVASRGAHQVCRNEGAGPTSPARMAAGDSREEWSRAGSSMSVFQLAEAQLDLPALVNKRGRISSRILGRGRRRREECIIGSWEFEKTLLAVVRRIAVGAGVTKLHWQRRSFFRAVVLHREFDELSPAGRVDGNRFETWWWTSPASSNVAPCPWPIRGHEYVGLQVVAVGNTSETIRHGVPQRDAAVRGSSDAVGPKNTAEGD